MDSLELARKQRMELYDRCKKLEKSLHSRNFKLSIMQEAMKYGGDPEQTVKAYEILMSAITKDWPDQISDEIGKSITDDILEK